MPIPKKSSSPRRGLVSSKIKKNDAPEKPFKARVFLVHKPYLCLSQFTDTEGRPTLAEFFPHKEMYAAGRLDHDSEGLLILSNFGSLQAWISDPKHKLPKTYHVQVEGTPTPEALQSLAKGVILKDGKTLPSQVKVIPDPSHPERNPPIRDRKNIPTTWLEITIHEGRNRQVRRMTAAVGFPTLRLIRVRVGPWELKGISVGKFKEVPCPETQAELKSWLAVYERVQSNQGKSPTPNSGGIPSSKSKPKSKQSVNLLDSDDDDW